MDLGKGLLKPSHAPWMCLDAAGGTQPGAAPQVLNCSQGTGQFFGGGPEQQWIWVPSPTT
jgi:hypothetical protein